MGKNCELCGKNASFVSGGGKYKGKTLCFDCYEKAQKITDEEELKAMGFSSIEENASKGYEGQGYIAALRVVAWLNLLGTFILSMMIWADGGGLSSGLMNALMGAIIFTVLYVLSIIAENIIAIRMNLEAKNKD